jgi:hypothetical protein
MEEKEIKKEEIETKIFIDTKILDKFQMQIKGLLNNSFQEFKQTKGYEIATKRKTSIFVVN